MKDFKAKKLLSLFILVLLLLTQLPIYAEAANTSGDIFYIENSLYSDISQNKNGNGWYWDAANFTLTLNGYNSGPVFFLLSAKTSKTMNIVAKNNNVLRYDGVPNVQSFIGREDFAALLVENCDVHISGGGTISAEASGKGSTGSLSASNKVTIENTTLNCIGQYQSFVVENIVVKNSVLNLDSPVGYWCVSSVFENSSINFKNSRSNTNDAESFASGGKHTFKNCTVDVLVGARPSDSTPIRATLFAGGFATYVFDNTEFKVRQGQHNHADNFITLFSLGGPANAGNSITITNNSRFELADCVGDAFRAFEIKVSNSSITGACTNNLFSSILLDITNSNVDVTCAGNTTFFNTLIVGQDINISNSNIKGRINGNIWGACDIFYPEYENNLSIIDTQLDMEGKVDTFVDSFSLNYKNPELWTVILDGVESSLSVNSPQLNLRHSKVVIKYVGSPNSPQTSNTTPSEKPTNQSVPEETTDNNSKESVENDVTPQKTDNNTKETAKNDTRPQKTDKKNNKKNAKLTFVFILVPVLGIAGVAAYVFIKRKTK